MEAIVHYRVASYEGKVKVTHSEDDDDGMIIQEARRKLRVKAWPLPTGYESWKVVRKKW